MSSATPASTPRTSVNVSGRESSSSRTAGAFSFSATRPPDYPGHPPRHAGGRARQAAVGGRLTCACGVNIFSVMDSRVRALDKIDPQPEGPAQARRIIADELAERVPGTVLDDVTLMVSELVTNGIGPGPAG